MDLSSYPHHEIVMQISANQAAMNYIDVDNSMAERNKLQIMQLYGLVNTGHLTNYDEIVDEHVVVHGPATGQEIQGRNAVKKIDESHLIAYPDAKIVMDDIIVSQDKVVVRWCWQGTNDGAYRGQEPTHRSVVIEGIHIYRFNSEGKIVEIWSKYDRLEELEQLGQYEKK